MKQPIFLEEIKNILGTNGDKLKSINETVIFVENVFCEEMALIVREICVVNTLRHKARKIEIMDIINILNNNIIQLKRLFKWLKSRSMSFKHVCSLQSDILEIDISSQLFKKKDILVPKMARIYENGQQHITKILNNKELSNKIINSEIQDITLKFRERKIDVITLRLPLDDYLLFQEMKTINFFRNKEKLKLWLVQYGINNNECSESLTNSFNFVMEDQMYDVFAYLAKEIILCLIDQIYETYYESEVCDHLKEEINKDKRDEIMEHIIKRTLSVGITVRDVKEAYRRFHFRPIHPSIMKAEDLASKDSLSEMNEHRRVLLLDS